MEVFNQCKLMFEEDRRNIELHHQKRTGLPPMTYQQHMRWCQQAMSKGLTCKRCGHESKNEDQYQKHRDSYACRQAVAIKNGTMLEVPREELVLCQVCERYVKRRNLDSHNGSQRHQRNLHNATTALKPIKFYCRVCNKGFEGPRGKRSLTRHCTTSKKHLKMIQTPYYKVTEDTMVKELNLNLKR